MHSIVPWSLQDSRNLAALCGGGSCRHGSTTTSVSPTSQASKQGSKQPAQSLYRCSIGSINLRDVVHLSSVKSIDDRVTPLFSHVATCGGPTGLCAAVGR